MAEFERVRIQRGLRQNSVILDGALHGVSQDQAMSATDGPDGWSVVQIVCHLRDLEEIFQERIGQMRAGETPTFTQIQVEQMAVDREYARQDLHAVREDLRAKRNATIALADELDEVGWSATGTHPVYGSQTVERLLFQVVLHDIDHLDQITRCLGRDV